MTAVLTAVPDVDAVDRPAPKRSEYRCDGCGKMHPVRWSHENTKYPEAFHVAYKLMCDLCYLPLSLHHDMRQVCPEWDHALGDPIVVALYDFAVPNNARLPESSPVLRGTLNRQRATPTRLTDETEPDRADLRLIESETT